METLNETDLMQFTGTERYYRHQLSGYNYTDGVQYLAEKGKAYWLIDEIMLLMRFNKKLPHDFAVWKLIVADDKTAKLVCEEGNYKKLYTKKIGHTDFPLPEVEMFFENDVLILPSEH